MSHYSLLAIIGVSIVEKSAFRSIVSSNRFTYFSFFIALNDNSTTLVTEMPIKELSQEWLIDVIPTYSILESCKSYDD
jgi:hypothetical protein